MAQIAQVKQSAVKNYLNLAETADTIGIKKVWERLKYMTGLVRRKPNAWQICKPASVILAVALGLPIYKSILQAR